MVACSLNLHDISLCKISSHSSSFSNEAPLFHWKAIRCYDENDELVFDITLFGLENQSPTITNDKPDGETNA